MKAALEQVVQLIGNLHAHLTRERRGCVLRGIHPSLQHMEVEKFPMGEHLFGKEAVKWINKRANEIKTLHMVKSQSAQFFRKGNGQVSSLSGRRFPSKGKGPHSRHPY